MVRTEKASQMLTITVRVKLKRAGQMLMITEKTEKASRMLTIMVRVKLQKAGQMMMIMKRMEKAGLTRMTGQNMEMIQKAGGIANTVTMATTVIMDKIAKTLQTAGGEIALNT